MIDKTQRLYESLDSFLTEYKEKNEGNKYRPVAVGRYGIRTRESIYSKELAKDYSKNKLIFKNTLTVGMGSTQIDIGVLSDDATYAVSPAYHTYRINGINSDYLRYCLECRNQDMFVRYVKRGSRQGKSIDLKRWITYKIPVYPESVQAEIVKRLDSVKAILSFREQELNALDELIRARFVEMFGDPVYSAIDSKIELSDICEKITDGEHGSVARVANGHPFLNAKHILKTGVIDWKTITYIGDEDHQRIYKRCNPEKGDILLTTTGTIGNVAIMPECEEVSMDRGITLLKINRHKVTSEFVAEMLKHPSIQMAMGANVHASAIGHLFMNKVKKLPAILPSMKKQIEFTTFVQQIDKSKLLSGCRLFHSWAPENRDKPKHVGAPRRRTKDLRGIRRQHAHLHH